MERQTFETAELKDALERAFGFALLSLERLGGASSLNFKAVRASDGMPFLVKCSTDYRLRFFDSLVRRLNELRGSVAVQRIFEKECPTEFNGNKILCLAWSSGSPRRPDQLTVEQFETFLSDFAAFSIALQKCADVAVDRPIASFRAGILGKCRGLGGWALRRAVETIDEAVCRYRPELLRVIHGDFHQENFLFVNGRLDAVLDLEEFRLGYPTDDLLRYFACAFDKTRWYAFARRRRILCRFAQAVRRLPYSRHEWTLAINARYICKIHLRTYKRDVIPFGKALALAAHAGLYRQMLRIVDDVFESKLVDGGVINDNAERSGVMEIVK